MRRVGVVVAGLLTAACAGTGAGPATASPTGATAAGIAAQQQAGGQEPAPIKAGVAPPPGPYAPGFDAVHYAIDVALPDTGSLIRGRTRARIALVAPRQDTLPLDLTGLAVDGVAVNGAPAGFRYEEGKLRVALPSASRPGDTVTVEVRYHGHPKDGLIIGPDVHGQRAAFADDWPNRARFWFPSIDHPSDKATADIQVLAPRGWDVVANGASTAPEGLPQAWAADTAGRVVAHWSTRVPIPTYTMVLGATRFAVRPVPGTPPPAGPVSAGPVRISTWLYPEDSVRAARSFRRANDIVAWYGQLVAPFPYEKLAHVESATRFGGMENAGAIFYDEKALAAGMDIEETVAHETAHQWFGDSVTEADWHHLWLSEGFATYFSALFFEHADGEERFRSIMRRSRAGYLGSPDTARPIIDPAEQDLFALLNRNNYDKGGWVLHMLRGLLGDSTFFDGLRRYYRAHAGGNALTSDLQQAMESAAGRDLGWFFQQWLYQPGYPRIRVAWRWLAAQRAAEVTISQVQSASWPTFRFPLDLLLTTTGGPVRRQVSVSRREETFTVPLAAAPGAVAADPDDRLLIVVEGATGH